jgi:hypothetical protein|tara:strand:- start:518 stop:769 length:252 start_codon:yes stop_codon:yes gene_type:complete
MKKINQLSLPTTIIIASIILGGFYYATQVNKNNSIERYQQAKRVQDCYDKGNSRNKYYIDEEDNICKIKTREQMLLEAIFFKK